MRHDASPQAASRPHGLRAARGARLMLRNATRFHKWPSGRAAYKPSVGTRRAAKLCLVRLPSSGLVRRTELSRIFGRILLPSQGRSRSLDILVRALLRLSIRSFHYTDRIPASPHSPRHAHRQGQGCSKGAGREECQARSAQRSMQKPQRASSETPRLGV